MTKEAELTLNRCSLCGYMSHSDKMLEDQCRLMTAILGQRWGDRIGRSMTRRIIAQTMKEKKSEDFAHNNYFAKQSDTDIEEVENYCDVEYLAEEEDFTEDLLSYDKKASGEVSSISQIKISVIPETTDVIHIQGDPVTEVYAEYDVKSNMFTRGGRKMDLISMLSKLSQQGVEECLDHQEITLEMVQSSPFFSQHRKLVRGVFEENTSKFDKTDPSLPAGFRVKETCRGDGKRVDREYLNEEGTIVLRSRPAVLEYVKVVGGDQ